MRQASRWLIVAAVAALALLPVAVACGGGGGGEKAVSGEVKIEAGDFYFKPSAITVMAGEPVKFVVTNMGKVEHEFRFPAFEAMRAMGHAHPEAVRIGPGSTSTVEMTFSGPATYEFVCGIPGHTEAGMKGTVTVVK